MKLLDSYPVLVVDDELDDPTAAGRATRTLVDHLRADGTQVITTVDFGDAQQIISCTPTLSALLVNWDSPRIALHHAKVRSLALARGQGNGGSAPSPPGLGTSIVQAKPRAELLVRAARGSYPTLPIFVLADRSSAERLPLGVMELIDGYVWKLEDTPLFVARHIQQARDEYLGQLLPPFFGALVGFVEEARYSWHTPGHSGGTAFLKTPVGSAFHRFFGENTLRSDLSVSVGELGSLLEHSGPVGEAEREAARIFGADRTLFVTNGTSTANKIVFSACVRPGDVVLIDRNCHKSVMHAIIMTEAIPVYLRPSRNAYGIIGPITSDALSEESVRRQIAANPLISEDVERARLAVVTNSTYDGLCYDTNKVTSALAATSERLLFDEAWFAYAHFHPLYGDRHAMAVAAREGQPALFATQSTHKLLAAFSQGSMVHLHDPAGLIGTQALDEAFMMHSSTSPQYGIIASLDVGAKMMEGDQGRRLIDEAIDEALAFRSELAAAADACAADDWCFSAWQPSGATQGRPSDQRKPDRWALVPGQAWHGFAGLQAGEAMLDPIKVTILTPGVAPHGGLEEHGIPAALVTRFLSERGLVVEKTGSYSFLVLFSLGITKGKAGTLLSELLEFKRLYDRDTPLQEALPQLAAEHPGRYAGMTLRSLADELHCAHRRLGTADLGEAMYAELPQAVVTPAAAYRGLVSGEMEMLRVAEVARRISAAMVVPYPPGIPVIMPGERFAAETSSLVSYLSASEALDRGFPGFENEIHGITVDSDGSYRLPCLVERP